MNTAIPRLCRFIIAAKPFRKLMVGFIARAQKCIPIERPRDLAKRGVGIITEIKNGKLTGENTKFKTDLEKGSLILCSFNYNPMKVVEIISDTECKVASDDPIEDQSNIKDEYKVCPKLEYSKIYQHIWEALNRDEAIGIFPEGVSHMKSY